MAAATTVDNGRLPIVKYAKSSWDDTFTSFTLDHQVQEKYAEAIATLKEEARSMLMAQRNNTTRDKLVFIDTLERLGVAYHFDQEIEEQLQQIFNLHDSEEEGNDDDLFTTALGFRLLREHRHHASSSIFNKFKGEDKKFKESLSNDVEGLLSLYEAAYLRIHGEEILEEAVAFTTHHLNRILAQQQLESSPLRDQVERALRINPLHRGFPRIEHRHYISFYEKHESRNELLVKLAKLDFNYMQNLHKGELSQLYKWWNELDVMPKLTYARARIVESHIWALGYCPEPRDSNSRVAFTKITELLTLINDTYDNYSTVEEADLFTNSLLRWDIDEVEQLPEHMRIICKLTLTIFHDYERDAAAQGKLFAVPYAKENVKEIVRAYNKRLKWFMGVASPTFEEHIANSVILSCIHAFTASTFLGVKSAPKEIIDWLMTEPEIVKASAMVCRYLDELGSYERERKQGEMLTGLDFYMKENGTSLEETADKFIELTEDAWKDLNREWIMSRKKYPTIPEDVLAQPVGYARAGELCFRTREDGYARPEVMVPNVIALYVDPIIIN